MGRVLDFSFIIILLFLSAVVFSNPAKCKPLTDSKFEEIISSESSDNWVAISELTDEQASKLANSQFKSLMLNGLRILTPYQAHILVEFKGTELQFNGLTSLDSPNDSVTEALATFLGGRLILNGLEKLSEKQARLLSNFMNSWLWPEFAKFRIQNIEQTLSKFDMDLVRDLYPRFKRILLSMDGLTHLSQDHFKYLSAFIGDKISLNGLKALEEASARELVQFQGSTICLNGIDFLEPEVLSELSKFHGYIELKNLNDEGREFIEKHFEIKIPDLLSLPDFHARIEGASLSMTIMTDGQTRIVSNLDRTFLELSDVIELSDRQFIILSGFRGKTLRLNGLRSLNECQATALSTFEGDGLRLDGLVSISGEAAYQLTHFDGIMISLNAVRTLDETAARNLASIRGKIVMNKITPSSKELLNKYSKE